MPATSLPYGFKPVRSLGSRPFTGQGEKLYRITSGYATNLFYGQPVALSSGKLIPAVAGFAACCGVFMGVEYVDPNYGLTHRQYWAASTATQDAADAVAYVATDPDIIYQAQSTAASLDALANIGKRYDATLPTGGSAGTTATGKSLAGVGAQNNSGELLLIDIADTPGNTNASGYVDVLVTFRLNMYRG